MYDLFACSQAFQQIDLPDASLTFYPAFLSADEADSLLSQLLETVEWQQETIRMYRRELNVPRLTAWYADSGQRYVYSGVVHHALPMSDPLQALKDKISSLNDAAFNSVLLNLYRNQNDSVAWHSDDEPELGAQPVIASLSLGQEREFQLRHKKKTAEKYTLSLPHGSLLIMQGQTQHHWEHQVAKSKHEMKARINLTFRNIVQ